MPGDDRTGYFNQEDLHWNYYHIVDDETFNKIVSAGEGSHRILDEASEQLGCINIYDALVFLGVPEQAVFGEDLDIGEGMDSDPFINIVEKDKLPEIIKELENVNIQELEKKFDPNLLRQNGIFPILMWVEEEKENLLKDIIEDYNQLLDIYRKAKDKNANIIIKRYDSPIEFYAARVFEPAEAPRNPEQFYEWLEDQYHHSLLNVELENKNFINWLEDLENIIEEAFDEKVYLEISDSSIGKNLFHCNFTLDNFDWGHGNQTDAGEIHKILRDLAKKHNLGYQDIPTGKTIFPDGQIIK